MHIFYGQVWSLIKVNTAVEGAPNVALDGELSVKLTVLDDGPLGLLIVETVKL